MAPLLLKAAYNSLSVAFNPGIAITTPIYIVYMGVVDLYMKDAVVLFQYFGELSLQFFTT